MSKPRIPRKAKKAAKKIAREFGMNGYVIPVQSHIWVLIGKRYTVAEVKK